ncbi:BMP family protein [Desulfovibrio sp. JC010]|uniref:BMP family lipoprotein n=1 Tax=Desulfovibrio sp. JC010 TaxID=2593641 RepID=UPI0013D6FB22|nr:BMP family ABC transporter substrate-binding protein [Desulfovibrio sp. JC010]NDV27433.1 BMP family ABC transporter substrate-binding protein [Desulfovibrio sp. JC010]
MKKLLAVILFLSFTIGTACAEQPVVGFVTGASGLGDLSYNDMSYGGIRKAQQEFNFKLIVMEPEKDGESTIEDFTKLINQSDILILIGAQHAKLVKTTAPKFPDKKFIISEVPVDGLNNVSSVSFKQGEGSFLAGALAAMCSKTGIIGYIGGTPVPQVREFEQGYVAGAKYAVPGIEVKTAYVSPLGDFSGFNAPAKGYNMAMGQYNDGADVIFTVAGLTGNGVIEAARRSGKYAIGVDSDQDSLAKGFVLTSMIKKMDITAYNELKAIMQGKFTPGPTSYGIKEGGVSLSEMKYTRDKIPAGVLEKVEDIRKKIINGEIKFEFREDAQ